MKPDNISLVAFLLAASACVGLLSSCAVVESSAVKGMSQADRDTLLTGKTDPELCNAYNHPLLKPATESELEKKLHDRGISGCIARGKFRRIPGDGTTLVGLDPVEDRSDEIKSGTFELSCDSLICHGRWGTARKTAQILYEESYWRELGNHIAAYGIPDDVGFYYLGRAADGMGAPDAAINYYRRAVQSSIKCKGVINNCDSLVFPDMAQDRLSALLAEREGADDWERVVKKGTIDDFKQFIVAYPKSDKVPKAQSEIAWLTALRTDTAEGYARFLKAYPYGRYRANALAKLWRFAEQENNSQGYSDFLRAFPDTEYSARALERIWGFARNENTTQAYAKVAQAWPQMSDEALVAMRDMLDPQIKQAAKELNCEKAKDLAGEMNVLQKDYYSFNYEGCLKYRDLALTLQQPEPRKLYLSGVKYEEAKEVESARTVYLFLMDKFSESEFALKASDRLLAIQELSARLEKQRIEREAAEAIAAAIKSEETRQRRREYDARKQAQSDREQADRDQQKAEALQRSTCQSARTTCINSCPRLANGRKDNRCERQCGYC